MRQEAQQVRSGGDLLWVTFMLKSGCYWNDTFCPTTSLRYVTPSTSVSSHPGPPGRGMSFLASPLISPQLPVLGTTCGFVGNPRFDPYRREEGEGGGTGWASSQWGVGGGVEGGVLRVRASRLSQPPATSPPSLAILGSGAGAGRWAQDHGLVFCRGCTSPPLGSAPKNGTPPATNLAHPTLLSTLLPFVSSLGFGQCQLSKE